MTTHGNIAPMIADVIQCYVDGSMIINETITGRELKTATKCGLGSSGNSDGSGKGRFDDFTAAVAA